MSQSDMRFVSDWQEIAARVAAEKDPDRILQLAQELIAALDRRTKPLAREVPPESKTREQDTA